MEHGKSIWSSMKLVTNWVETIRRKVLSKLYSEPTLQKQEQAAKHRELIFIVVVVALPASLDVRLGVRRSEFGGNTQHSEVSLELHHHKIFT